MLTFNEYGGSLRKTPPKAIIRSGRFTRLFEVHGRISDFAVVLQDEWPSKINVKWWESHRLAVGVKSVKHGSNYWNGVGSLLHAMELAGAGWPDGANQALKLAEKVRASTPEPGNIRRKRRWADDGDEVDEQRVFAGNMDQAFRKMHKAKKASTRAVSIFSQVGGHIFDSGDNVFWQGVGALVLVDVLEEAGYRVELNVCFPSFLEAGLNLCTVRVKDYHEPVAVDALAASVCHSGIIRALCFAAVCKSRWSVGKYFGYEFPRPEYVSQIGSELGLYDKPDVVLGMARSSGEALKQVRSGIEQIERRDEMVWEGK